MKRSTIVAAGLFVIASGAGTRSQAQMPGPTNPVSFGISGGLTVPTGDFADGTENGFNVGAHLGMRQPMWPVALRLDGQLNRFEAKSGDEVYFNIIGVSLNAVFMSVGATGDLKPYIIAGPNFFHTSSDAGQLVGSGADTSDNRWGFNAGGGLQYQLSGFTTFVEARYNWVKTSDNHIAFVPISVGIMFR